MISTEDNAIVIYTDGSSYSHPRRGGYGIRIYYPKVLNKNVEYEDFESFSYSSATNNEMELLAVVTALRKVESLNDRNLVSRVIVCTDSQYVSDNFNNAKYNWPKTKWFLKNGTPVQNAELWKDLVKISIKIKNRVEIRWVRGHSKDAGNKAVDKIAKQSARGHIKILLKPRTVRRKMSPYKVNPGSIESLGQRISIRVITDEYMPIQKLFKYKIEVISKSSKYFQYVDFVFSKMILRAGHSYFVSLKKDDCKLSISKIIREIVKAKN